MLFLAAAAALLAPPPPTGGHPVSATAQATATIRVISAVRVKLGEANPDLPQPRIAVLRSRDGSTESVKLIEFQ
jgi:hypothetical protein